MPVGKVNEKNLVAYFVQDCLVTDQDKANADKYEGYIVFRNALYTTVVEAGITAVAGDFIPEVYKNYPRATKIRQDKKGKLDDGETPTPNAKPVFTSPEGLAN